MNLFLLGAEDPGVRSEDGYETTDQIFFSFIPWYVHLHLLNITPFCNKQPNFLSELKCWKEAF